MSVYVRRGLRWELESLERTTAYGGFGLVKTPFRCRTYVLFSFEGEQRTIHVTLGKNGGYRYMRYFLEGVEVKQRYSRERFSHFDLRSFMEGKYLHTWVPVASTV